MFEKSRRIRYNAYKEIRGGLKVNREIEVKVKCPYSIGSALSGDVGHDVRSMEDVAFEPGETKLISTMLYTEMEEGIEAQVRPRSGMSSKGILVHFGTVDSGYRGEIKVIITNLNKEKVSIKKGNRVAQLVFRKCDKVRLIEVEDINDETERGVRGFGSTGEE